MSSRDQKHTLLLEAFTEMRGNISQTALRKRWRTRRPRGAGDPEGTEHARGRGTGPRVKIAVPPVSIRAGLIRPTDEGVGDGTYDVR